MDSQPGHGSTFLLEIPVKVSSKLSEPPEERFMSVANLAPGQVKNKILVVDDTASHRDFLVQLLEPLGFEVCEAEDGLEAVSNFKKWSPDIILMDTRMPRMDGISATRQINSKHFQSRRGRCW